MKNALLILTILVGGFFCSCQKNPPVASFECSPATGDAPLSVQFENTSTNGEVYEWNFDDGEKSSDENPTHTFASAGSYTVVLKVSNNDGVDMTMNTVKVEEGIEAPTASFTCSKTTAIKDESITFTNNSTFGETYEWNFGDGATATTKDASHVYSTTGSYTVVLKVKNKKGVDVTSQSITINTTGSGGNGGGDGTSFSTIERQLVGSWKCIMSSGDWDRFTFREDRTGTYKYYVAATGKILEYNIEWSCTTSKLFYTIYDADHHEVASYGRNYKIDSDGLTIQIGSDNYLYFKN